MSILVISNNKVSTVRNNGKTISSIFGFVKLNDFFQLSLHNDEFDLNLGHREVTLKLSGARFGSQIPEKRNDFTLADLAESTLAESIRFRKNSKNNTSFFKKVLGIFSRKSFTTLVVRDFIYIPSFVFSFFKVSKFIKDNKINRIFFVYSDFLSFQFLVYFLSLRNKIKIEIYFTDDYLLNFNFENKVITKRVGYSCLLNLFLKKLIKRVRGFYSISDKMARVYEQQYGFVSTVLINNQCLESVECANSDSDTKVFSYFGSLHSGRVESLVKFCKLVEDFNSRTKASKISVRVFTDQIKSLSVLRQFDCLDFNDLVFGNDYIQAISDSDFLLLIEGFDAKSVNATWLSCSTKVPEYLSSRKPIVAFGALENGSIDLLVKNELAFLAIDDSLSLAECFDPVKVDGMVSKGYSFYQRNFSKNIIRERLKYESI